MIGTRRALFIALLLGAACGVDERHLDVASFSAEGHAGAAGFGASVGTPPDATGTEPSPQPLPGSGSAPGGGGGATASGGTSGAPGMETPGVTPVPPAIRPDSGPPLEEEEPTPSPRSDLPVQNAAGVPRPSGSVGNLRVLPWAGFRAAVSYTFDDANSSQLQNYASLQGLGVPLSFYLQTGKADAQSQTWAQAVRDGHELGNHTQSHQSTGANIGADTDAATAFIESRFGVSVWTMAAPNGSAAYSDVARTRFLINRGVTDRQVAPNDNSDPFNMPCYIPPTGATAAAFNAKVDAVRSAGNWQTVLVHGFTGGTDGAFQPVPLAGFLSSVNYAKSLGDVWIDTLVDVAAYWLGQRLLSAANPVTSNQVTTWSWTLPDHFPPGQFVRVVVDGGTLRQGATILTWDEHGYYEVALDAGSVSLSP
jgi:peptidoglycan/xylan/chitin deacetylase (PgdA/CDA1 family)